MSVNNSLIDGLAIIKNGYSFKLKTVLIKKSKKTIEFLQVLKKNGFIRNFSIFSDNQKELKVFLKYSVEGSPAIRNIKIISTPSNYAYCDNAFLWALRKTPDFSCFILDSPVGIVTSKEAFKAGTGGELLCRVS
jgi:small subunit ribosomal protein S8